MIKLLKIRKTKSVNKLTKTRLIKALVWPIALYDCESWRGRKPNSSILKQMHEKDAEDPLYQFPKTRSTESKDFATQTQDFRRKCINAGFIKKTKIIDPINRKEERFDCYVCNLPVCTIFKIVTSYQVC